MVKQRFSSGRQLPTNRDDTNRDETINRNGAAPQRMYMHSSCFSSGSAQRRKHHCHCPTRRHSAQHEPSSFVLPPACLPASSLMPSAASCPCRGRASGVSLRRSLSVSLSLFAKKPADADVPWISCCDISCDILGYRATRVSVRSRVGCLVCTGRP